LESEILRLRLSESEAVDKAGKLQQEAATLLANLTKHKIKLPHTIVDDVFQVHPVAPRIDRKNGISIPRSVDPDPTTVLEDTYGLELRGNHTD
jgi:hypothetical protein